MSNFEHRTPGGSRLLRWSAVAVLAFLALHSLSYGFGFITDPATGAGEFGNNDPLTEAAENLAGLVGVILLLLAAAAIIAAAMLARRQVGGAWLALGMGISLISIGGYWASRENMWDAGFYGISGVVLVVLGGLIVRHRFSSGGDRNDDEISEERTTS